MDGGLALTSVSISQTMEPFERRSSRSSLLYHDLHIEAALQEFEAIEDEIFGKIMHEIFSTPTNESLHPDNNDNDNDKNEDVQVSKSHIPIESQSLLENM